MADPKLERLLELRDNFALFAAECLKIRQKDTQISPFVLNKAQKIVHDRLEAQKKEHGWIRALVLKGRQQGMSTYVSGRFYQQASSRKGVNVYILSHEQSSSDALFDVVDRYQRNNPMKPHVGVSNVKELVFDRLDSSYAVATAGSAKASGRSRTITLFHGSEVAYWANAPEHFAASVQAVPLMPGTEVILESTSAGSSGEFYNRWSDAESGHGDYIPIFIPWWLSEEYARDPEADFVLNPESEEEGELSEVEYADTFKLSLAQMCWRRNKIYELRSPVAFRREYPAVPAEAWTSPVGFEPFISPVLVLRARKRTTEAAGPLILGVDPASMGGDRFSVAARRGLCVQWVRYRNKINHLEGTAWLRELIDEMKPARVNIDAGNIGTTIVTNLKALGPPYLDVVRGVNFGGTSQFKLAKPKVPGPQNRRAEMWARCRDWLLLEEGVAIPDEDAIQSDLTAPRLKPKLNHDFILESKLEMRSRGVRSPDLADAIVLTFASNEWIQNYEDQANPPRFGVHEGSRPVAHVMPLGDAGPLSWMG